MKDPNWKTKEIERRVKREMNRCLHFTGIQHDECKVGVNYHELLGSGIGCFAHMPCMADDKATVICEKRRFPTEAEARAEVEADDKSVQEFLEKLNDGRCPQCEQAITQRQVGSCVYGSCGHRLYQGKVNPKYAEA